MKDPVNLTLAKLPLDILQQIGYREPASFGFQADCTQPYGALESVLAWCRSECQGDWRWNMLEMSSDRRPGLYRFYFDSERDCVAFSLRWC